MTEQEFYRKIDGCISRFRNGQVRYKTSPTFNRVVQMLVRGEDPYEVIDKLTQIIDDNSEALEQQMRRKSSVFFIKPFKD